VENDIVRVNEIITLKKTSFPAMLKGTPEFDEAKKELKLLEKEKSACFREIKSLKGKIKSKEMDIKSAKNTIEKNELDRKKQQLVIQEKKQLVGPLVKKKEGIQ
jgi:chromosome segregation ATPase